MTPATSTLKAEALASLKKYQKSLLNEIAYSASICQKDLKNFLETGTIGEYSLIQANDFSSNASNCISENIVSWTISILDDLIDSDTDQWLPDTSFTPNSKLIPIFPNLQDLVQLVEEWHYFCQLVNINMV